MSYQASPVPCAGCGELTPYEVGDDASYGEHLETPLGLCFRRTHRVRVCVLASREACGGRPVTPPAVREAKLPAAAAER